MKWNTILRFLIFHFHTNSNKLFYYVFKIKFLAIINVLRVVSRCAHFSSNTYLKIKRIMPPNFLFVMKILLKRESIYVTLKMHFYFQKIYYTFKFNAIVSSILSEFQTKRIYNTKMYNIILLSSNMRSAKQRGARQQWYRRKQYYLRHSFRNKLLCRFNHFNISYN